MGVSTILENPLMYRHHNSHNIFTVTVYVNFEKLFCLLHYLAIVFKNDYEIFKSSEFDSSDLSDS